MDKLKLVKTIVFIITFLLIFGTFLLLGTLYKRTHRQAVPAAENISLAEPQGSRIVSVKPDGGNLYILVRDGGKSDRIIVYSVSDGKKTNSITLN